jgi:hypothetical protein
VQATDTVDEVVRRAVVRATNLWQPKKLSNLELILRELAIDGGRKPKNLPQHYLTVRLKYAIDGARYAAFTSLMPSHEVLPFILSFNL